MERGKENDLQQLAIQEYCLKYLLTLPCSYICHWPLAFLPIQFSTRYFSDAVFNALPFTLLNLDPLALFSKCQVKSHSSLFLYPVSSHSHFSEWDCSIIETENVSSPCWVLLIPFWCPIFLHYSLEPYNLKQIIAEWFFYFLLSWKVCKGNTYMHVWS